MAEMANEKVQVYGEVAILSYNYMGLDKDATGTVEPTRAKSTRVYVKKGHQWLLVHANFAPAEAPTGCRTRPPTPRRSESPAHTGLLCGCSRTS